MGDFLCICGKYNLSDGGPPCISVGERFGGNGTRPKQDQEHSFLFRDNHLEGCYGSEDGVFGFHVKDWWLIGPYLYTRYWTWSSSIGL